MDGGEGRTRRVKEYDVHTETTRPLYSAVLYAVPGSVEHSVWPPFFVFFRGRGGGEREGHSGRKAGAVFVVR